MNRMALVDDGTLDTVFRCGACGREDRYTGGDEGPWELRRDETGALENGTEAIAYAWFEHLEHQDPDDPEACDNQPYETVADRGAW